MPSNPIDEPVPIAAPASSGGAEFFIMRFAVPKQSWFVILPGSRMSRARPSIEIDETNGPPPVDPREEGSTRARGRDETQRLAAMRPSQGVLVLKAARIGGAAYLRPTKLRERPPLDGHVNTTQSAYAMRPLKTRARA